MTRTWGHRRGNGAGQEKKTWQKGAEEDLAKGCGLPVNNRPPINPCE